MDWPLLHEYHPCTNQCPTHIHSTLNTGPFSISPQQTCAVPMTTYSTQQSQNVCLHIQHSSGHPAQHASVGGQWSLMGWP